MIDLINYVLKVEGYFRKTFTFAAANLIVLTLKTTKMKKLFNFLLLAVFALAITTSCSDDDDNKATLTVTGEAVSYNSIELKWNKINDAWNYQVFYKTEGDTEWKTSNYRMALENDPATITWDSHSSFLSFSGETEYIIVVKAFRDSRESSVIAESAPITIKTLDYPSNSAE